MNASLFFTIWLMNSSLKISSISTFCICASHILASYVHVLEMTSISDAGIHILALYIKIHILASSYSGILYRLRLRDDIYMGCKNTYSGILYQNTHSGILIFWHPVSWACTFIYIHSSHVYQVICMLILCGYYARFKTLSVNTLFYVSR